MTVGRMAGVHPLRMMDKVGGVTGKQKVQTLLPTVPFQSGVDLRISTQRFWLFRGYSTLIAESKLFTDVVGK